MGYDYDGNETMDYNDLERAISALDLHVICSGWEVNTGMLEEYRQKAYDLIGVINTEITRREVKYREEEGLEDNND